MSTEKHDQMPAATAGCAAAAGYVASDPDAMNGWEILRDAINDGALDAEHVNLMGYGYACAKTNDGRQIAIATRGGWMLLPWEIVRGMADLLPHTKDAHEVIRLSAYPDHAALARLKPFLK
jgi:hypothetical protein